MSKALKPADSRMRGVVFELDRFELDESACCELQGRWFGVRGRRFMRPALTLIGEGQQVRLLADLVHKPWDAEDGQPWQAAFQGEIDSAKPFEAELTVAPDITIALPAPKARNRAKSETPARRARVPASRGGGEPAKAAPRAGGGRDATPPPDGNVPPGRLGMLTRELAETHKELRQSKRALATAERERIEAAKHLEGAVTELAQMTNARDEMERERDQLAAEHDAAQRSSELARAQGEEIRSELERVLAQRDAAKATREDALADRDAALRARDEALSEREAAVAARDQAVSRREAALRDYDQATLEREAAVAERDEAVARRDAALSERDRALSERGKALSERDGALAARDEATSERDAMKITIKGLRNDLEEEKASRGAALVMRHATQVRRTTGLQAWLVRALALVAVLAVVVVLVIVLGGV